MAYRFEMLGEEREREDRESAKKDAKNVAFASSPCTQGEGRGGGSSSKFPGLSAFECSVQHSAFINDPLPTPPPEYKGTGNEKTSAVLRESSSRLFSRFGDLRVLLIGLAISGCAHQVCVEKFAPGNGEPASGGRFHYPTLGQVGASDRDILGDEALAQPGGVSYAFLRDAMPPLRYVDADFHVYPIVLCAPANPAKGRLVGNGSAVNALGRQPDWRNEIGTPVTFYLGDKREMYGSDPARLSGPVYADGYLPIVQSSYTSQGSTFAEEVFCSTDPKLADHAAIFVKFTLLKSDGKTYGGIAKMPAEPKARVPVPGVESEANTAVASKQYNAKVEAQFEGYSPLHIESGVLVDVDKQVQGAIYPQWGINPGRRAIMAPLKVGDSAYLAIFTKDGNASLLGKLTPEVYQQQRQLCAKTWNDFLHKGMEISTPEALVNHVSRALLIGNEELKDGNVIRYSASNGYANIYIGEGGDTVRATTIWGHADDARAEMIPQFKFTRKGLEFHQAAFKLQMLADYYRLTHDEHYVRSIRPLWEKELKVILDGRQKDTGMLPREKYCGDIATMVYSLNSNSNCWRALRDMSVLLDDLGEHERAADLAKTAAEYRQVILDAIAKATRTDVNPPFVPIALSGEESPHDPIWGTTMGSYWNLMIEYVLGSGVFRADSPTATDIVHYLQEKGGLCMGILRARAYGLDFYVAGPRLNDLYGMRYALLMDQRDEPDRALLTFYAKLAQGMTRGTFIDCEGSSLNPVDQYGRQMYLPPNSAGNASFLQQLRYLLIQDYDLNDDGKPDTLRLMFATPRSWLVDGKTISVHNAPTAFGEMSITVQSHLANGQVLAEIDLPAGEREATYLRLRLPDGHKLVTARAAGHNLKINGETIDLSEMSGHLVIQATVK